MISEMQEHDKWDKDLNESYNNLSLVSWCKPTENASWGYYASYKIGAEWVDDKECLVVTTKRQMENIDFLNMFMTCFNSGLALEEFSKIYSINLGQNAIEAPSLNSIQSLLIIAHFLQVVNRIRTLKKGYVHYSENLKKVKGRVNILKNERKNVAAKRFDRIYCEYDEYSINIPENRLLKKALLVTHRLIMKMGKYSKGYGRMKLALAKNLARFEYVSQDVELREVNNIKGHTLFTEYNEAIRLAKIILHHYDHSINTNADSSNTVIPFVLDMSLLYEHYVYGLLHDAYADRIVYQYEGVTGKPDFLYFSDGFKAILDTKYIPKYESCALDNYVVRQLSGYSRDIKILKRLGYADITEESPVPDVPCVIIYPTEGHEVNNPFMTVMLKELCLEHRIKRLSQFYKIAIPLPVVSK